MSNRDTDVLLKTLPRERPRYDIGDRRDHVYTEHRRDGMWVCILLDGGGWIGCPATHFAGDIHAG